MSQTLDTIVSSLVKTKHGIEGSLLEGALDLRRLGFPVFPLHSPADGLCSCGRRDCRAIGKHPRTASGFKDATLDAKTITRWWTQMPFANVGVATGNGLVVLDLDSDEAIQNAFSRGVPDTAMALTGKGLHIYFTGEARSSRGTLGPGIDVRGSGGYVVAPPSLHAAGHRYEWFWHPDEQPLTDLPDWVASGAAVNPRRTASIPRVRGSSCAPLVEGSRNDALLREACAMRGLGHSERVISAALAALNEERCSPPLDLDEIEGIARSSARYPAGRQIDKTVLALKLGPYATTAYLTLRTFAGNDATCFPSYEALAERAGIARTSVIKAIDQLEEAGLISVVRGGWRDGTHHGSNTYTLLDPEEHTEAPAPAEGTRPGDEGDDRR